MAAHEDSTHPVEVFFEDAALSPGFQAQVEAAREAPWGLSKLYNDSKTVLRFWTVITLLAVAAVPLIVFLSWRSSWWLLLALVLPPLAFFVGVMFGTIARRRMEMLRPLAAEQNQNFLADAWQRITAEKLAAENAEKPDPQP